MPRIYTYRDLLGQKFGNWLVIAKAEGRCPQGGMLWKCECQCDLRSLIVKSNTCLVRGKKNQSCGCKARNKLRPYEALYNRLKYDNRWNRRAREVLFSYEEFLDFMGKPNCHYCELPVQWTKFNLLKGSSAYRLDRKDNTLPYTVGNCVVCCERCNKAKREWFSYEEWYGMTEYLRLQRRNNTL